MASTPITAPPRQEGLTSSNSLEKKLQKKERLSRILVSIATLASLEVIALIVCASLALISWPAAAVPIVMGLITVAISLFLLNMTLDKKNQIKQLLEKRGSLKILSEAPLKPTLPPTIPSLKELSSLLSSSSEALKKEFFPLEEDLSSLYPATWFSRQRLRNIFSRDWIQKINTPNHYFDRDCVTDLILKAGDISILHIEASSNHCGAIVNAANANMFPGGARIINATLSKAVTAKSWENSKEGKARLNVSEVSAGRWASKIPVPSNTLEPSYLFQALDVDPANFPSIFQAYNALIVTYLNCFKKAASLGVTHLQLPLLSRPETSERIWANMTESDRIKSNVTELAFLAGLTLFLDTKSQDCSLKHIILIDPYKIPSFY